VDGEWTCARTGAQPEAHELVVEKERAARTALVRWPLALGDERAMRDSDRRTIQHCTKV
jgi:hypothetical protein